MNEAYENLITRVSTRNFKPDMVSDEEIDKVVYAGLKAPTAKNTQENVIIVIKDKKVRDEVSRINASIMGMEMDPFYGAPVIIIVAYKKSCANGIYDGSLVLGNMMNAAHALGLGSCWIHRARQEFELPEFQELLRSCGIGEDYIGVGHLALGYVNGELAKVKEIKPNRVINI